MERETRGTREPQSLEAWETWVDHLIVEAQERGEFDNLPGHGKPLQLEDAPFAGGLEVGFGMLKSAGVAPMWVELEKEMRSATERLDELIARAAATARERPARAEAVSPETVSRRWWWPFGRERSRAEPPPVVGTRPHELARLRREYLDVVSERNRLIGQYNAAIPRALWHLERPRLSVEEAERAFDAATARG